MTLKAGLLEMHLHRLQIINFRALENIDVEFDGLVNVIIGPNAIGKTTILEAIRLAKSLLAARTQSETQQTMFALGIMSPHLPNRLLPNALTHDPNKPTVVKCAFRVEPTEVTKLESLLASLVPNLALQSIGQPFPQPAQAMGFLNSEPGKQALAASLAALTSEIARLKSTQKIELNLTIDYRMGSLSGEYQVQQLFYSALEQQLDPTKTIFSYFPADRAMPTGEQPVQLGMADTNQQLESYNS